MSRLEKTYEFRDPVHGFITLSEWERDIVNHPAFQRLRRIKQLAWTEMVYPGASHSRFEHSLGVMHIASSLFDSLWHRQEELVRSLGYKNEGGRQRQVVRLAALLHDIGHSPFSHAAEELFPIDSRKVNAEKKHYTHEQYSAAIIEHELKDVIEQHPQNLKNHRITIKELTNLFRNEPTSDSLKLRDLVDGQIDADRMDYLLRDSLHCGVSYGSYDLKRLIATLKFVKEQSHDDEDEKYSIGIGGNGLHAAEGLIIARYMMFTQVYFHKTRVIYDYHLVEAMKKILSEYGGQFPPPITAENIKEYLEWDDWRVQGVLASSTEKNALSLKNRLHYRSIYESLELSTPEDEQFIIAAISKLKENEIDAIRCNSGNSWYKFDNPAADILVEFTQGREPNKVLPMSQCSPVIRGLPTVRQSRIYVSEDNKVSASKILAMSAK